MKRHVFRLFGFRKTFQVVSIGRQHTTLTKAQGKVYVKAPNLSRVFAFYKLCRFSKIILAYIWKSVAVLTNIKFI